MFIKVLIPLLPESNYFSTVGMLTKQEVTFIIYIATMLGNLYTEFLRLYKLFIDVARLSVLPKCETLCWKYIGIEKLSSLD